MRETAFPRAIPGTMEMCDTRLHIRRGAKAGGVPRTAAFQRPRDEADWDRLSEEIRSCQRCSLHKVRTQAVVYRGGLSPQVVFLGEARGRRKTRLASRSLAGPVSVSMRPLRT